MYCLRNRLTNKDFLYVDKGGGGKAIKYKTEINKEEQDILP